MKTTKSISSIFQFVVSKKQQIFTAFVICLLYPCWIFVQFATYKINFAQTVAELQSNAQIELSERAFENFSTRRACPLEKIKRVYPEEYDCQCGQDTSCSRVWVLEGCGKKDVYKVDEKDTASSSFFQTTPERRDGTPQNGDAPMTNEPYVPIGF